MENCQKGNWTAEEVPLRDTGVGNWTQPSGQVNWILVCNLLCQK
jgi:hypothetical protein